MWTATKLGALGAGNTFSPSTPLPVSTNRLWRTGKGRVFRSKVSDSWIKAAGWELLAQRPGQVEVSIALGRPDSRKRDLDNAAGKAVLDLLVAHQVIEDDSLVTSKRWDHAVPPGRAMIVIKPAMADIEV